MNSAHKITGFKSKFLWPENKSHTPDIYTFQESKSTLEVEQYWNSILPGQITYAHSPTPGGGIVLGVHPASSLSLLKTISNPNGRYIVASCGAGVEKFTVVSVYFTPQMEKGLLVGILSEIAVKVDLLGNSRVVWVGDFNIVFDLAKDTTTTHLHHHSRSTWDALLSFIDQHDLTDVWHTMNPLSNRYTTHSRILGGKTVLSRLDYYLVSPAFLTGITNAEIGHAYMSDHSPITLDLVLNSEAPGKGYWKFPKFLLSDTEF